MKATEITHDGQDYIVLQNTRVSGDYTRDKAFTITAFTVIRVSPIPDKLSQVIAEGQSEQSPIELVKDVVALEEMARLTEHVLDTY